MLFSCLYQSSILSQRESLISCLCCRSENVSPPPRHLSVHLRAVRWLRAAAWAPPAAGGLQHRQGAQRRHGKPRLQRPARLQGGAGLWHVSDSSLICKTKTFGVKDGALLTVCLSSGPFTASTQRRSTSWRSTCTTLRWWKGEFPADQFPLMRTRIIAAPEIQTASSV